MTSSDHQGGEPVSRYHEFLPPPRLSRHLVCTWTQLVSAGAHAYPQRVLPDGCVDILWFDNAPPVVVGPSTRYFVTPLPPRTTVVGARLRPGWASQSLGIPASELLDREVSLAKLWRGATDRLSDQLAECQTVQAKLAAIEQALAARWAKEGPADLLVGAAVAWLAQHPADRVHRLAGELGVSSRQLQRRFVSAVGYGPKTFQRIVRFQQLIALGAEASSGQHELGGLALAAGYADQAHMTREVRELAGKTPSTLLGHAQSTLGMSELFKTTTELPA